MTKTTLSIIVTAHNEGILAHKTLLSIKQAISKLDTKSITYEVIAAIDNGTDETLNYMNKVDLLPNYKVITCDFKDLSQNRNNAVKKSSGKYVCFIDADDLMSSNWLEAGLHLAEKHSDAVIHPEYSITFGDDRLIWKKRNSSSREFDTLCLIDNNLWDSPALANREIFEKYPYRPNGNGFGYEDKLFNCETISGGITHMVAPETILFVRRKVTGSLLLQSAASRVTVAKNNLFSFKSIQSLNYSRYEDVADTSTLHKSVKSRAAAVIKPMAKSVHSYAKKYKVYTNLVQPLREERQKRILLDLEQTFPRWLKEAWKEIHHIENQTFPAKELLKGMPWYSAENISPGLRYVNLIQQLPVEPDTLFFVPHLIKGGADMLFINYPTDLKKHHPDWNIVMLQTEAKESVWKDKLPPTIPFIDLYRTFEGLDFDTQFRLLATLVTQNNVKRIIIGNSQLAYDFVGQYQTLIKRLNIAVYCYAFGEEFDDEGRLWGHIHTGIPKVYPVIHRVISDNASGVEKLVREYAFDVNKFTVHYQPTTVTIKPVVENNHDKIKILWASRVCKQKRPDILKRVSSMLDSSKFTVHAYGQLEEGLMASYFNDSNVIYKGPFNGLDSLPTDDYDIFLYTSEGDGVPNVLQEITASGLPIVASNVGGIGEFIETGKTGILIEDHEDIEEYVRAIEELTDQKYRVRLVQGAQKLLKTRFAYKTWTNKVLDAFDK